MNSTVSFAMHIKSLHILSGPNTAHPGHQDWRPTGLRCVCGTLALPVHWPQWRSRRLIIGRRRVDCAACIRAADRPELSDRALTTVQCPVSCSRRPAAAFRTGAAVRRRLIRKDAPRDRIARPEIRRKTQTGLGKCVTTVPILSTGNIWSQNAQTKCTG